MWAFSPLTRVAGPSSRMIGSSMGYYTYFTLQVVGNDRDENEFKKELSSTAVDEYNYPESSVEELVNYGSTEAKFYEIEEIISLIAEKYPNLLIILNGDGEESGDIWEARWKGDQYEKVEMSMPPFKNENLLMENEKKNNK